MTPKNYLSEVEYVDAAFEVREQLFPESRGYKKHRFSTFPAAQTFKDEKEAKHDINSRD